MAGRLAQPSALSIGDLGTAIRRHNPPSISLYDETADALHSRAGPSV